MPGTAAALLMILFNSAAAAPDNTQKTWTDPDTAVREDSDFKIQGEYRGTNDTATFGAQVVALGGGRFECFLLDGGLPGAGWEPGKSRRVLMLKQADSCLAITLKDDTGNTTASLLNDRLTLHIDGATTELTRIERKSPTLDAKPPEGAIMLFDGSSTDEWENAKMENGLLLASGATSKRLFKSYKFHLEFRTPYMPGARGQKRGNSGVYHSGRWETQILDSFGLEGEENECGGIYSISKPRLNMCLPPLVWQTYDVEFTAAKFAGGKRTAWPRITVKLNGVTIHENLELSKDFTTSAPITSELVSPEGPVFIQNHNDPVAFRNIWIVPTS
jgi:hypothetical protein